MSDVMTKTKEISTEINVLNQENQAVRQRITELKKLVEERKNAKATLEAARREEAELLKLLEGI